MADVRITSIDQVQTGLFVKFRAKDDGGWFTHTGEVTKVNTVNIKKEKVMAGTEVGENKSNQTNDDESFFEMLTMEGTMGFGVDSDEHELYLTTVKPPGWAKFKKRPDTYITEQKENNTVPVVKTKKEQVKELVGANPKKNEKSLLKLAIKEIGGAEAQLKVFIKLALAHK